LGYPAGLNVSLGSVLDQFVADLLKSGLYQTQSEVLREGLRLLKEREEWKQLRITELRRQIAIGGAEADRSEFVAGAGTFAAIRKRCAERQRVTR
jgi:antitoxin ParD1/3/4